MTPRIEKNHFIAFVYLYREGGREGYLNLDIANGDINEFTALGKVKFRSANRISFDFLTDLELLNSLNEMKFNDNFDL